MATGSERRRLTGTASAVNEGRRTRASPQAGRQSTEESPAGAEAAGGRGSAQGINVNPDLGTPSSAPWRRSRPRQPQAAWIRLDPPGQPGRDRCPNICGLNWAGASPAAKGAASLHGKGECRNTARIQRVYELPAPGWPWQFWAPTKQGVVAGHGTHGHTRAHEHRHTRTHSYKPATDSAMQVSIVLLRRSSLLPKACLDIMLGRDAKMGLHLSSHGLGLPKRPSHGDKMSAQAANSG